MVENNEATVGVSTDYDIAIILNNFPDELIQDMIKESLDYRFRPFGFRAPNYPEILNNQFDNIIMHSSGHDDQINEQRVETLTTIIKTITDYYALQIVSDIPDEQLYTVCYLMYQLFVSEFTDRMVNFFTQFILNNISNLINRLDPEDKVVKTSYVKKVYSNQDYEIIYENIPKIADILTGLDIPLYNLITYLADNNSADIICNYITDTNDVYKNHFATFLTNPTTSADIITKIRLQFASITMENINQLTITTDKS